MGLTLFLARRLYALWILLAKGAFLTFRLIALLAGFTAFGPWDLSRWDSRLRLRELHLEATGLA